MDQFIKDSSNMERDGGKESNVGQKGVSTVGIG